MPQIPDYTQAQTINTTDLFVIEQQDGTKKATVAQIKEKTLDGLTAANLPLGSDFSDPTSTAGAIKALQDGTVVETITISTTGAIANLYQSNASKQNKLVVVNLNLSLTSSTSLYALLCTMSKKPVSDIQFFLHSSSNNLMYECKIFATDGKIQWWNNNTIASGAIIGGQLVYFTND